MSNKNLDCFKYPPVTKEEHLAIKAVFAGEADQYQQKLALAMIINKFSRSHEMLYYPDSFDQTSFINGRAFVGQQVLKLLNIPVGKLNPEEKEDETE